MTNHFPFSKFLKTDPKESSKNSTLLDEIINSHGSDKTTPSVGQSFNEQRTSSHHHPFEEVTQGILETLKAKIPQQNFEAFIDKKITVQSLADTKVIIGVKTQFILNTLEKNYKDVIALALQELMGAPYEIQFILNDSFEPQDPLPQEKKSGSGFSFTDLLEKPNLKGVKVPKKSTKTSFTLDLNPTPEDLEKKAESRFITHMEQNLEGLTIDPNKTFDTFVVGPSNNMAFATSCAVADSPGKDGKYPCIFMYSDSGLGKTHLLHSVANGIAEKYPHLSVCLISARDFMKELIDAFKDKTLSQFQKKYTEHTDVLMIDDIHELKNKNSTQEEFFHIFNSLHNKGKQLIFTSDKSPDQIDGVEERIITRLQWGLVVDISKPDFETRTAILKKKAMELDFLLQDEVMNLIASSIKTSIRELEGSLIRLQASAELLEAEIDTEMAREILKISPSDEKLGLTLEVIAKATAQFFKVPLGDLKSKARNKDLVRARHAAWHLSKTLLGATYKEIASFYDNRDHSSVIHGVNKIGEQLKADPSFAKEILLLENNL